MKCPKCNYISFDYNELCPKCDRDLTAERQNLNFPSFRPDPPFLLSALVGELSAPMAGSQLEKPTALGPTEPTLDFSAEDSQAIEAMEEAFKDSQDLEIQLEPADRPEPEGSEREVAETEESRTSPQMEVSLKESGEEFTLDLEDLALENSGEGFPPSDQEALETENDEFEETAVLAPSPMDEEDLAGDLDELSLDHSELSTEDQIRLEGEGSRSVDLEELASAVEDLVEDEKTSPSEIPTRIQENQMENTIDLDELSLDSAELATGEEIFLEQEESRSVDLEELASAVEDLVEDEKDAKGEASVEARERADEEIFVSLDDLKEDETGEVVVGFEDPPGEPKKISGHEG